VLANAGAATAAIMKLRMGRSFICRSARDHPSPEITEAAAKLDRLAHGLQGDPLDFAQDRWRTLPICTRRLPTVIMAA
jgi:hypothetical protein